MRKIFLLNISFISLIAVAQTPTPKSVTHPGSISPIVPITVKGNIVPPLPSEAKEFILWYRGKKVNDSILITPDATLVLFSTKRDMVVVQPAAKKDPTHALVKELANTQKRKDEFYNKISERKSSVMMYPIIASTFNEYDEIQKTYSELLKNTVPLPPEVNASAFLPQYHSSGYANVKLQYVLSVPEYVRRAYNQVLNDKKNYPSIEFPPPPARDFGACIACDTTAASKQSIKENEWNREFVKYEAELLNRTQSIFKSLESLKLNSDPEAVQMRTELEKVMEFAWARIRNKTELLIRNYGNDFTRLPSVIRAVISSERQKQLLGNADDGYGKMMAQLIPLFGGFDKYLEQQMKALNYDVVFNLGFILSVERQRQLLNATEENKSGDYIDMFNSFNRFKIEMELDYNSTEEDTDCGTSTDKVLVKNDGDQYVTLFAADCKYGLYKNEQHLADGIIHQFGMGEPVLMKTGKGTRIWKHIDENDADRCITETFNYSNIPVLAGIPGVRLRFCENESKDSLFISPLHIVKNPRDAKTYLFTYISTIFNSTGDVPENEELNDELDRIQDQMEVYTLNESKLRKKLTLEETQRLHQLIARREAIVVLLNEQDPEEKKFLVTFDAKNGQSTIIDIETPLTYDNEDMGKKATINVKIRVVHDPMPFKWDRQ